MSDPKGLGSMLSRTLMYVSHNVFSHISDTHDGETGGCPSDENTTDTWDDGQPLTSSENATVPSTAIVDTKRDQALFTQGK